MNFKKRFQLSLFCLVYAGGLFAQGGTSAKTQVEYTIFMKLPPGEKVMPIHSCMWLNEKNEFYRLVIQRSNNKYSVITSEGRKDDLSYEEMHHLTSSYCGDHDPHKPRKSTRYVGSKLAKTNANGSKVISSGNKSYGPFQQIIEIQELGQRFVATVKTQKDGKTVFMYVDSDGRQKVLNGQPHQMICNETLTKVAVLMPSPDALPTALVNAMPREKAIEYYDQLSKKDKVIWFNNDSTAPIAPKFRRLEYDVSGRHFLKVYTGYFFVDGIRINKDISAATTRFFAGKDPKSWVFWYEIYLGFSDGAAFKDVDNAFMTTEDGKDYLNWFVVESNKNGDIIKWAKKEL